MILVAVFAVVCPVTLGLAQAIPLPDGIGLADQHNGYNYTPFELKGARLIPRVEFLQPGRGLREA